METISPDAEHAEMIHLFSLPLTPQDRLRYLWDGGCWQRKTVMPSGQGLITSKKLREASGLSLFCRPPPRGMGGAYSFGVSRKGKVVFLCDLCASSEAPQGRDKRAVRHKSIHITAKPWPRPGMQGLNFIARASLILKRQ